MANGTNIPLFISYMLGGAGFLPSTLWYVVGSLLVMSRKLYPYEGKRKEKYAALKSFSGG